jgi:hypothetical protein
MRRLSLAVPALVALVVSALPALGEAAPSAVRFHHRQLPTLHVYIADAKAGTVDRFPLIDGVLASTPDATLDVPQDSLAIGVARNGTMYVGNGAGSEILVYAAGAQGNAQPIQTIPVPIPPIDVSVDASGYIFTRATRTNGLSTVYGYAPSGVQVTEIDFTPASSLAFDPQGNLYLGDDDGFNVYATPETAPTLIRSACTRIGKSPIGQVTVSQDGRIFMARIGYITRARDTLSSCPFPFGLYNMFVQDDPSFYLPYLATGGGYLFSVEYYQKRLLQLDPNKANQKPISDVRYAGFQGPYGIAVGP